MRKVILALLLMSVRPAYAIQIDDLSMFMSPQSNMVGQKIENTSSVAHLVTVSVEAIDSPYTMKALPVSSSGRNEIQFTPERILIPAGGSEFVKFYYRGKSDERERYYRVTWIDDPLSQNVKSSSDKNIQMHAIASVGTVLVVQPRVEHFAYKYLNGKLSNTGNSSFRIVAYGPCKSKASKQKTCQMNGPIAPGHDFNLGTINLSSNDSHVGIWRHGQLIPVELIDKA